MATVTRRVLSQRALNRATLDRQLLLQRQDRPVLGVIDHLVGMQAQVPRDPYLALWSRLVDFEPSELEQLIIERRALRMSLHRSTIHLVTAEDCLALRPLIQPVPERMFKGSQFSKQLPGVDMSELLAAGRALVEENPRTRAGLRQLLGPRWPEADPDSLAFAVTYLVPLVQVPPRGL